MQSQTTPINLNFSEFDEESIIAFLRFVYTGSSPTDTDDNVELRQMFSLLLERYGIVYCYAYMYMSHDRSCDVLMHAGGTVVGVMRRTHSISIKEVLP